MAQRIIQKKKIEFEMKTCDWKARKNYQDKWKGQAQNQERRRPYRNRRRKKIGAVVVVVADGYRWIAQFYDIESRFCRVWIDCRTSRTNPNLHTFWQAKFYNSVME